MADDGLSSLDDGPASTDGSVSLIESRLSSVDEGLSLIVHRLSSIDAPPWKPLAASPWPLDDATGRTR
jgi:hypothetical protein